MEGTQSVSNAVGAEPSSSAGLKRPRDEETAPEPAVVRPTLNINKQLKESRSSSVGKGADRWRVHRQTEDYVNVVGDIMYPNTKFSPFGYDPVNKLYPLSRVTALGFLTNPIRKPSAIEKWSPLEIATFEASISLFGKDFPKIKKYVSTKSVKEVIEFYYAWKKTNHYKQWKKVYRTDPREQSTVLAEEAKEKEREEREAQEAALEEEYERREQEKDDDDWDGGRRKSKDK